MHGELHPAAFIEEALEHQRLRAGHDTKCPLPLGQICRDLLGGGAREPVVLREPSDGVRVRSARGCSGPGSSAFAAERSRETAALTSSLREGASPSQNGIEGGWPCASATRTTPLPIRRIRHDVFPSWKISPGSDSMAKSSFSVPMNTPSAWSRTR